MSPKASRFASTASETQKRICHIAVVVTSKTDQPSTHAKMLKEKYWAVRIGKPGKHTPYLRVDDANKEAPGLYATRESASQHLISNADAKVIRVEIRQIRAPNRRRKP